MAHPTRAGLAEVLRIREFSALLAALVTSGIGDQLARVALAVAVLHRSGSLLLTSAVYAVSFLPWVVGGPILTAVAARRPPRRVLVTCDLLRAALVALMLLPGLPVAALLGLVFVTELAAPPFDATRSALLPDVLEGDRYVVGSGIVTTALQLCQVGGLAVAGALVAAVGTRCALLVDAATFVLSAALVATGVQSRPAALQSHRTSVLADARDGVRAVFGSSPVRSLVLLAWVGVATSVVPESLAVGLAGHTHAGPTGLVALLVALPLGTASGAIALTRVAPDRRHSLLVPLLLLTGLPLLAAPLVDTTGGLAAVMFLCGVGAAFFPLVATTVGRHVAPEMRSRVFGIAASGLMAAQGLTMLASGALAQLLGPVMALPVAGLAGLGLLTVLLPRRQTPPEVIDLREQVLVAA